jgi:hypothetical protein
MAILRLGILSGFNNKIANVVGFKWNNLDVIRSYVIPTNPNTVNQISIRSNFRTTVKFSTIAGKQMPKIKNIWQSLCNGKQTWFSNVVQANYSLSSPDIPTVNNIISPAAGLGLSLTNIELVDNSLSFNVPALNTVIPIDSADKKVSFQIAYCFANSTNPSNPPFLLCSQQKDVDSYNFNSTYSFNLIMNGYAQHLASEYQLVIAYIVLIIEDTDGIRTKYTKTIQSQL